MTHTPKAKRTEKPKNLENHNHKTKPSPAENTIFLQTKQKPTPPTHPFPSSEKLHPFVAISPKLKVSTHGDKWEQEADRMADEVLCTKDADIKTGKKPPDISAKGNTSGTEVDSPLASEIQNLSGGQPLARKDRDFFEPRFGMDLGGVRVHTGNTAERLAEGLSARAFTYRNHVVFGKGEYSPGTGEGRRLLAHELAHTIQQQNNFYENSSFYVTSESIETFSTIQRTIETGGTVMKQEEKDNPKEVVIEGITFKKDSEGRLILTEDILKNEMKDAYNDQLKKYSRRLGLAPFPQIVIEMYVLKKVMSNLDTDFYIISQEKQYKNKKLFVWKDKLYSAEERT